MKTQASISALLGMTLVLGLTGCPSDGGEDGDATASSTDTEDPSMTDPSMTDPSMTDPSLTDPSMTDPSMTDPSTDTSVTDPDTSATDPDTSGSSSTGEGGEFEFPDDPYDAYTQIDRHGAVEAGTAGILASAGLGLGGEDLSVRDEYNASNPVEDAAMMWVPEIAESVTFFHDSFDDDIVGLGLTPASFNESIEQAGPVIIPDTIKYDPSLPTGYPNGRGLEDRVVDITLAAVLIDLGQHPLDTFASIPLNPGANDVPFEAEFPYLAPPHPPMR